MKVIVTGAAGFIGFHTALRLLAEGYEVVGIDNVNSYYDVQLKENRIIELGRYSNFIFKRVDLADKDLISEIFQKYSVSVVIHLGAQAGVRYSIDNPHVYVSSNINGTLNILEGCRQGNIRNLIYASSSSVYGANKKYPFSVKDRTDTPISFYAATKKSNEVMCESYSALFGLSITGFRFFTVYGPWGRPDMAYFKFAQSIVENRPIQVFNNGEMKRDFTYIDDIVDGIISSFRKHLNSDLTISGHNIYNLGNNKPEALLRMIEILEEKLEAKAQKIFMPMQPGDVKETFADITESQADLNFSPGTSLDTGLGKFATWFKNYYAAK